MIVRNINCSIDPLVTACLNGADVRLFVKTTH